MHAFAVTGIEAVCGMWWIGGTALGNGGEFLPSDKGM